jgi:serine/threonine protein kinase
MGRVYLARSPGGRMVAVKVIRANLAEDSAFRARFAREVAAARKVGGLYTAQVVDADLDGPVPWLVTAYVPGTSLSDAVEQQGPLPAKSVLALAAGLAEGVSAIHAAGVIHRDLKPSNVLLAQDGPRIIDFGISSAAEATSLTGTGFMVGSPGFMSPEQAEGLTVGPASDIFSLAGVLIYAARGEGPFGVGDTAALLYRVVHGTPNIDQVPADIQPLIRRSLSRDAKQRPTATEFLAELSAAYPSAADLSDWLPSRLLGLSGQRAASGDTSSYPPGMPGTFGPAFNAAAAEADEVAVAGGVSGPAGSLAAAAGTEDPTTSSNTTTDRNSAAEAPTQISSPLAPPPTTQAPPPPTQATPQAPGSPGAGGYSGARGNPAQEENSGRPGYPGQHGYPGQPGYSSQPGYPGQPGYSGQRGHSGQPGYSGQQGYWGAQQHPAPPGYATGQGDPVAPAGSGAQGGAGGAAGAGNQWWATQQAGGALAGAPQAPVPGGRAGSGAPGADQPSAPPTRSGRPRKRPGWLLPAGAGAAILVVVVALVLALGGKPAKPGAAQQTTTPSSSPGRSTSPAPNATPTVGPLQLTQFQVGDCLTGSNMDLNTNTPWPKITQAVPCSEAHTAQVFYANSGFWPAGGAYPGNSTISKDANAECNAAFSSYVGITYSNSKYTWTNIVPDSSTWPTGDRALHCVAYYATKQHPAGAPITGSIEGTRQ